MEKVSKVYTNNKGWLSTIGEFNLLRGISNKGRIMGIAENDKGKKFEVAVADCGVGKSCWCAAWAEEVNEKR